MLSFRIATFTTIAKIAAKKRSLFTARVEKKIRLPLKKSPSFGFFLGGGGVWGEEFGLFSFFPNPCLTLLYNKNASWGKVFHDRLEFYLKPCFHKIAAIAKIEIKSAIVVLKKLLYYLEDGGWDAEDQLAYKSPTKTMQALL